MEPEQVKEKWEEVCYLLREKIKGDVKEEFFEKEVLLVLEKLNWSQYKGEIAIKPPFSWGSQQAIRPDYVLYDQNKKPAIVVEVKRPSEDINSSQVIGQLTSYMRQPKVDFGLLIGNQIHFYYDGNLYPHDDPILLAKINFNKSSEDGLLFVNIFEKFTFYKQESLKFLKQWIEQYDKKIKIKKLKRELVSSTTSDKIIGFLKKEFASFGVEIVNEVMKDIEISVSLISGPRDSDRVDVVKAKPGKRRVKIRNKSSDVNKQQSFTYGKMYKLRELNLMNVINTKPDKLQIQNINYDIDSWTELCKRIVQWLIEKGYLTKDKTPIFNSAKREKYFINTKPVHLIQERNEKFYQVGDYYVDTKYEANVHVKNILSALKDLGAPSEDILISLRMA